jgi:hypothetical protein
MGVDELFRRRKEMVGVVRRGVEGVLHEHGFAVEDCLLTVGGGARTRGRMPAW